MDFDYLQLVKNSCNRVSTGLFLEESEFRLVPESGATTP